MVKFRAILLWLMMLAVPLQGYAAAAMAFCAPEPAPVNASMAHDHDRHGHDRHGLSSPQGAAHHHAIAGSGDDAGHHHAAQSQQDDPAHAQHKCGSCAACHAVGMTPTPGTCILHGLPQADLAEPLYAMATVSPGVPHKPPRA